MIVAKKPSYEEQDQEIRSLKKRIHALQNGEVDESPRGTGTFSDGIAHDFNNILQTIAGYAQILLTGKDSAHPDYNKLKAISAAAGKASDLISQLLPDSSEEAYPGGSAGSNQGSIQMEGGEGIGNPKDRGESVVEVKERKGGEPGGTETILLVDDDQNIRELLKEILDRFDYRVLSAQSGEESLEIYREKKDKIDLVLMDLNMPGMGGRQCLKELLDLEPALKVIVSSGHCTQGEIEETMRLGAAEFLTKPYHHSELLKKIRETLDGKKDGL
jgi:CheY-like chemotaxis protein